MFNTATSTDTLTVMLGEKYSAIACLIGHCLLGYGSMSDMKCYPKASFTQGNTHCSVWLCHKKTLPYIQAYTVLVQLRTTYSS